MSKYNESSTNWKLDSWHSIVLQIFILALIGGLSIFIYAKFLGPETTVTGPKGPKITALETKNRQFSKEIADLKDQIEKAEKVVTNVLGGGEEGDQLTLLQARESFDSMFAIVGSINDEDQNATFTDAQTAYDNLNEALKELKTKGDLSVSEVLKVGLGLLSPLTRASFDRGVMQGLAEACFVSCQEYQASISWLSIGYEDTGGFDVAGK